MLYGKKYFNFTYSNNEPAVHHCHCSFEQCHWLKVAIKVKYIKFEQFDFIREIYCLFKTLFINLQKKVIVQCLPNNSHTYIHMFNKLKHANKLNPAITAKPINSLHRNSSMVCCLFRM